MKSKAVKRREARERIEKSLPALEAEAHLVKTTLQGAKDEQLKELAAHYAALLRKLAYRREEIERIKDREAGRGARKEPHPEIVR